MDVLTPEERAAHDADQGIGDDSPKITYRHNRIARFQITHNGHLFAFRDHMLTIPASLEQHFKEAYRHMLPQDQASIVKQRVTNNEMGVLEESGDTGAQQSTTIPTSTAVRGPVGTTNIPGKVVQDGTGVRAAPVNPLAGLNIKPTA
jgi:hypothetical protein